MRTFDPQAGSVRTPRATHQYAEVQMSGALTVEFDLPQQQAVQAVTASLAEQGFGVLTNIDVRTTLKAKLGVDVEDYVALGACNPPLAHQALSADRRSD